jgi:hypothetical protein
MSICEDIIAARGAGTRCGLSSQQSPSVDQLAEEFGLETVPSIEIEAEEAHSIMQFVLQRSLAYNSRLMAPERAAELATLFLAQFRSEGTQYYTNGGFMRGKWMPATLSTFDTGVLVVGPRCSGCLWVEEED